MEKPVSPGLLCSEYFRLCQIFYECYDKYDDLEAVACTADTKWYSKGGQLSIGGYFPLNPIRHLSIGNVKKGRLYKTIPKDKKYDFEYWVKNGDIIKIGEESLETFSFSGDDEIYRISFKKRYIDGDSIIMPYYVSRLKTEAGRPAVCSFGIIDGIDRGSRPVFQFECEKFVYSGDTISGSVAYNNLQLRSFSGEDFGRLIEFIKGDIKLCCPEAASVKCYTKLTPYSILKKNINEKGTYTTVFG